MKKLYTVIIIVTLYLTISISASAQSAHERWSDFSGACTNETYLANYIKSEYDERITRTIRTVAVIDGSSYDGHLEIWENRRTGTNSIVFNMLRYNQRCVVFTK